MLAVLLSLTEIWNDFNLILKIFVLMTIYSWVKNHVANKVLSWVVFGAVTFFVVFDLWTFFGTIYIMWLLLMFGISHVIIDFFFVTPRPEQQMEQPVSHGIDVQKRQQHMAHKQHAFAQQFMRR